MVITTNTDAWKLAACTVVHAYDMYGRLGGTRHLSLSADDIPS